MRQSLSGQKKGRNNILPSAKEIIKSYFAYRVSIHATPKGATLSPIYLQ